MRELLSTTKMVLKANRSTILFDLLVSHLYLITDEKHYYFQKDIDDGLFQWSKFLL